MTCLVDLVLTYEYFATTERVNLWIINNTSPSRVPVAFVYISDIWFLNFLTLCRWRVRDCLHTTLIVTTTQYWVQQVTPRYWFEQRHFPCLWSRSVSTVDACTYHIGSNSLKYVLTLETGCSLSLA